MEGFDGRVVMKDGVMHVTMSNSAAHKTLYVEDANGNKFAIHVPTEEGGSEQDGGSVHSSIEAETGAANLDDNSMGPQTDTKTTGQVITMPPRSLLGTAGPNQ
jgi:hypothetical protein